MKKVTLTVLCGQFDPIVRKFHNTSCISFWFFIFYVFILLTAIWLSPGGSSTVHIYTQTIHRTTQNIQYIEQHNNLGQCGPCPVLASYILAFALQLRGKHRKTSTNSIIICRSNVYSWHWLHNHLLYPSHAKLLHSLQMNLVFLSFDQGQMSLSTSKYARMPLHDYPRRLAITLRPARHRTSQKKKNIHITWKVLRGPFVPKRKWT